MTQEPTNAQTDLARGSRIKAIVAIVIVAVFLALLVAKFVPTKAVESASTQPSAVREDPVEAYDAALAGDKPIYLLFHSLTCDPCIEISAAVDQVVPGYADSVTFVNVITDDPAGQQLATRFDFQYIPTSFFVSADGEVFDSYTGVLTAPEMRARLDALIAAQ